jgi:hypothetical protein
LRPQAPARESRVRYASDSKPPIREWCALDCWGLNGTLGRRHEQGTARKTKREQAAIGVSRDRLETLQLSGVLNARGQALVWAVDGAVESVITKLEIPGWRSMRTTR